MTSSKYVIYISGLTASVDFPNISGLIIIVTPLLMHFWIKQTLIYLHMTDQIRVKYGLVTTQTVTT
jgi:hypothetical protein